LSGRGMMGRMARLPKRSEAAAAALKVGQQRTLGDGEGGVVPVNTAYTETFDEQVARIEAGRKPKLVCSVCAEPQFEAPDGAGITCKNGHGGADGISVLNASTAGRPLHPDKPETRVSEPTPDEEFLAAIDEFSDEVGEEAVGSQKAHPAGTTFDAAKGYQEPTTKPSVPAAVLKQAEQQKASRNIPDLSTKTPTVPLVEIPGAWKDPPDPEPPLFDRATGRKDRLAPQFERLVTTVFDVSDIDQEFEHLKRQMVLGEQRSDYATVLRALDEAEDNARRAHRLFVNAQLEEKRFRLEREIVEAAMHKGAVASLKESGDKVTVEATQARMVVLYAEEWREGEERKARVKGTVGHCEQLAFFFSSRCRSLQVILQSLRK
jgi:hypothetical protein